MFKKKTYVFDFYECKYPDTKRSTPMCCFSTLSLSSTEASAVVTLVSCESVVVTQGIMHCDLNVNNSSRLPV